MKAFVGKKAIVATKTADQFATAIYKASLEDSRPIR
jgi:hypothetical protein